MKPERSIDRPEDVRPVRPIPMPRGDQPRDNQQAEWRSWMQEFGQRLRKTRMFLELSQEEVAREAGVSQGAVSRLETAHGLATPLLVVLKVQQALAHHLRQLDPGLLSAELQRSLEFADLLATPFAGAAHLTGDARLDHLVKLYRETPERHRQGLLAVVQAVVDGFKHAS